MKLDLDYMNRPAQELVALAKGPATLSIPSLWQTNEFEGFLEHYLQSL